MVSPPDLGVVGFVPQQLVSVLVGRYQLNLYPKLTPGALVMEHAHAFQICKSALASINIDIRIIFDALGLQLNCMATINGLVYDFTQVYEEGWYDPTNLQILSFHDSTGMRINNTTIAGNPTTFSPSSMGHWLHAASRTCVLCMSRSASTSRIVLAPGTLALLTSN
jgi:hypothetical protein